MHSYFLESEIASLGANARNNLHVNLQTARCPTVLGFEPGNFEHLETTGYETL
jgi:hypothetical protein